MNTREIEDLLDRFYEGDTTPQEENILREFFLGPDVPAHLGSHRALFAFYREEREIGLKGQRVEQTVNDRILDQLKEKPVIMLHRSRSRMMFITGIAAGFLLLIGLFFTLRHDLSHKFMKSGPNPDAEMAFANASEALIVVSSNLNVGLRQVEKLQMMDKAMKNITLFNKFYQYQTIIINRDEIETKSRKTN